MIQCKHCRAPLLTGTKSCAACGKPVLRNRKPLFFTIGGVVFALFVVAALLPRKQSTSATGNNANVGKSSVYVKPATRSSYHVTYGVDAAARVTYTNEQGGIQQEAVPGGWSKTFTMRPGAVASMSAQIDTSVVENITATILVDGQPFRRSESSGRYAIASARGVCCLE